MAVLSKAFLSELPENLDGRLSALCLLILGSFSVYSLAYLVYQRYFHPLAKFPGPFSASLTNLWKVYQCYTLELPQRLCNVHEKYGPVIRIGPNDLSFNGAETIAPIYKSGRKMLKGPLYDAFVSSVPDVFSTRDETFHALRLKQVGGGFQVSSLKNLEPVFDIHVENLIQNIEKHAKNGTVLDLKQVLAFYGYDITGQLAFDTNFDTLVMDDPKKMPPLHNHFFMGNLYGCIANMLPHIRNWTSWLPWVQVLAKDREVLAKVAYECIQQGLAKHESDAEPGTLLASLINAKDPETGAKLSPEELLSESFVFLVAGAHTTSSAMVMLLFFLHKNPAILAKVREEIDAAYPGQRETIFKYDSPEAQFPYTFACVQESFRMAPTAALLFPRTVMSPAGAQIGETHVPQDANCNIVSTVLHHNPKIWGSDHNTFDPDRFFPGSKRYDPRYPGLLLHFGAGHRQCVGRNIAMMSIWKIMVTLFKRYEFEPVNPEEELVVLEYGVGDKKGPFQVRVKRRIF